MSALTALTFALSSSAPLSFTSLIANSAPGPISATIDSIGPVNPRKTPIVTSLACPPAKADAATEVANAVPISNFFINISPFNGLQLQRSLLLNSTLYL